jgi:hypothetical protein
MRLKLAVSRQAVLSLHVPSNICSITAPNTDDGDCDASDNRQQWTVSPQQRDYASYPVQEDTKAKQTNQTTNHSFHTATPHRKAR